MQKRKIDKSVINLSSLAKCYWNSIDGLTGLAAQINKRMSEWE